MKHRSLNYVNTHSIMIQNTPIIILYFSPSMHKNTMYLERDLIFYATRDNVKKIHVYLDFHSSWYANGNPGFLCEIFKIMNEISNKYKVKIVFHYNEYQYLNECTDIKGIYHSDENPFKMAINKHLKNWYPNIIVLNSTIDIYRDDKYSLSVLYHPRKYMDRSSVFDLYFTYNNVTKMISDGELHLQQFNPNKTSVERKVICLNV